MANSLAFNGTDLSGTNYGVTLMEMPVPVLASPRVQTSQMALRHGGYARGGYSGILQIPCKVAVIGSSSSNLRAKLDNLNYLMAPENGDKSIKFDFISDRYWLGRLASPIAAPIIGDRSVVLDWTFLCADPIAYASSLTTQEVAVTTSPQTVLVEADTSGADTVDGNVITYPTFLFYHTAASGLAKTTAIRIKNESTGHEIGVTMDIDPGEYLRINCETELIEHSDGGSTWTNANAYRSATYRRFPYLLPQVQNELTLTVTGNAVLDLDITYRARYRS